MAENKPNTNSRKKPPTTGVAIASLCCGLAALVLTAANALTFYYYLNSGGLNRFAAKIWPMSFNACLWSFLVAVIVLIASFVVIPFRNAKRRNLLLSLLALASGLSAHFTDFYTTFGFSFDRTRMVDARYFARNEMALKAVLAFKDAISGWAQAHDGRLPQADNWQDAMLDLDPNVTRTYGLAREGKRFALNESLRGFVLKDVPSDVVVLFEAEPGANPAGGPESITPDNHYGEGSLVLFGDLHLEFVKAEDFNDLRWKPYPKPV